jgi:hypothetical protein
MYLSSGRTKHERTMPHRFLSDEWFAVYNRLRENVEIPDKLAELLVNLNVRLNDGSQLAARMQDGFIHKGHADGAIATIAAPEQIIYNGIVLGDLKSALPAVFAGDLRIDGSKAALIKLAGVAPTPSQRAFTEQLRQITTL